MYEKLKFNTDNKLLPDLSQDDGSLKAEFEKPKMEEPLKKKGKK